MYCPKCGAEISEDVKFCGECGANAQTGEMPGGSVNNYPPVDPRKSRMVAGLLQIFLGSFGVGRFYLGYTGIGVAQLVVTWATCGLGALWPFIDGILILTGQVATDADGQSLKD